jgi:hypothetical protein
MRTFIQNIIYDIYHQNPFLSLAADPSPWPLDFCYAYDHILQHPVSHRRIGLARMADRLVGDHLPSAAESDLHAGEVRRLLECDGTVVKEDRLHAQVQGLLSKEARSHVEGIHPLKKLNRLCVEPRGPVH